MRSGTSPRNIRSSFLLWLLAPLVIGVGRAQEEEAAAPRHVVVQNLAPFARSEWVHAVVPFAQGAAPDIPDFHVAGQATVWQPFGARWSDGSVRQALCFFRQELGRLEEKALPLRAGPGPELEAAPFGLPTHRLRLIVDWPGGRHEAQPRVVRLLEDNAARKVALLHARLGNSGLTAQVTYEMYAGQAHAYVGIGVFHSDPKQKKVLLNVKRLSIEADGMALFLRHPGPLAMKLETTPTGSRAVLLENTHVGDGQGIRRVGVLVPPLAGDDGISDTTLKAASLCPPLAATSWVGTGAFGAFGFVPPPPPWLGGHGLRTALGRKHAAFVAFERRTGNPFMTGPYGQADYPNQPGDQNDFGLVALEPVAWSGIPSFLYEVELSVMQEACRPGHYFETDGSQVTARNHPNWVVWSGRTHWNCQVSSDRLGKPCPVPKYDTHNWSGKDRQHWSCNYLATYYLLTGDPQALLELQNESQLWLAEQTVDPRHTTSTRGTSRAAGRATLVGCWLYLCTADQEVWQRLRDRVHRIHFEQWAARKARKEAPRPFHVNGKDPRLLAGKRDYWVPWEEGIAATGFAAYHRLSGDAKAKDLAEGLALGMLRHGWRIRGDGRPEPAIAVAWLDAKIMSAAERNDTDLVWWPKSSFGTWCVGALEIAKQAAAAEGDAASVELAERSLRALRAGRRPPRHGFYDRFSQWDALR